MNSYIESGKNKQIYVAVIDAGKCKTFSGFRKEMVAAFSLPNEAESNTNDIGGYIFSSWVGFKKIKIILNNSGGLRKNANQFNDIMNVLNTWKSYWESLNNQNKLIIEIK